MQPSAEIYREALLNLDNVQKDSNGTLKPVDKEESRYLSQGEKFVKKAWPEPIFP